MSGISKDSFIVPSSRKFAQDAIKIQSRTFDTLSHSYFTSKLIISCNIILCHIITGRLIFFATFLAYDSKYSLYSWYFQEVNEQKSKETIAS